MLRFALVGLALLARADGFGYYPALPKCYTADWGTGTHGGQAIFTCEFGGGDYDGGYGGVGTHWRLQPGEALLFNNWRAHGDHEFGQREAGAARGKRVTMDLRCVGKLHRVENNSLVDVNAEALAAGRHRDPADTTRVPLELRPDQLLDAFAPPTLVRGERLCGERPERRGAPPLHPPA